MGDGQQIGLFARRRVLFAGFSAPLKHRLGLVGEIGQGHPRDPADITSLQQFFCGNRPQFHDVPLQTARGQPAAAAQVPDRAEANLPLALRRLQ